MAKTWTVRAQVGAALLAVPVVLVSAALAGYPNESTSPYGATQGAVCSTDLDCARWSLDRGEVPTDLPADAVWLAQSERVTPTDDDADMLVVPLGSIPDAAFDALLARGYVGSDADDAEAVRVPAGVLADVTGQTVQVTSAGWELLVWV